MDVTLTVRYDFKARNIKDIAKQVAAVIIEFGAENDDSVYLGGPIWPKKKVVSGDKQVPIGTYSICCKASKRRKG